MDDGLKQRLLGALVLLALAVIFLPVLFDRERMEPIDTTSQVPPRPEVDELEVTEPEPPQWSQPVTAPEEMFIPDEQAAVAPEAQPQPEVLAPQGEPNAWVLQVGSFSDVEHARQLRDALAENGHTAFIRRTQQPEGEMHRVYVGPKLNRSALVQAKSEIDTNYSVDSLLLPFTSD